MNIWPRFTPVNLFIDTSAFYALMDGSDRNHEAACATWQKIVEEDLEAVSSNYVFLESFALIQARLGLKAARVFQNDMFAFIQTQWVDREIQAAALGRLFAIGKSRLSLVDATSFEIMERLHSKQAFAFDADFAEHGFDLFP